MHRTLILNTFSAKAKTRKNFGFPRSRARSHGALPLVHAMHINRQNSMLTLPSRTLYHHYLWNALKKRMNPPEIHSLSEATNGFEPMIRELQSHALPLG